MIIIPRRCLLAIAAVVDVGLHARPIPVSATALAQRLNLPPRHLEALLQALVHADILKGMRGPRGGYELARERRKISAGDIIKVALSVSEETTADKFPSPLVDSVIAPLVRDASTKFYDFLADITLEDLCARAEFEAVLDKTHGESDYAI